MLHETSWSNECISTLVGYRSAKDLYGLVREATGLTPDELRRRRDGGRRGGGVIEGRTTLLTTMGPAQPITITLPRV